MLSGVAENTLFLRRKPRRQHLKTKVRLTEKYRHHKPRIDARHFLAPGPRAREWPEGCANRARRNKRATFGQLLVVSR